MFNRITYDPAKNARNIAERDLPFELVTTIDWDNAEIVPDTRRDYGEVRITVVGMIGVRLHVAIVTERGDALHVISLRKANRKEIRRYDQAKKDTG